MNLILAVLLAHAAPAPARVAVDREALTRLCLDYDALRAIVDAYAAVEDAEAALDGRTTTRSPERATPDHSRLCAALLDDIPKQSRKPD